MSIFKAYDIRGIYGDEFTEELAEKIGRAFVDYLGAKTVITGHDMRSHSLPLIQALTKGMLEQGADVINIGLCSTPMTYFANGFLKADGSIMVTASHNTAEYNGMKMCRADAIPLSGISGIKEIEEAVLKNDFQVSEIKGTYTEKSISEDYATKLKTYIHFNHKPQIVVDYANAVGVKEIEGIVDQFDITPMYENLDGTFPNHEANPLKVETLNDLCAKVIETGAEFGAGFDGDADRCGFVDEKGIVISMDLITALIAQDLLQEGPSTILYDLRSSWAVKECIEANGGTAVMSRVGHAFIKKQMRENDAIFGGELSGHYYFKDNYYSESQGLALILIANLVQKTGKKLSELVEPLRKYSSSGEVNSTVADAASVLKAVKEKYADAKQFELDGLSVEYSDWWCNVRSSNTEPLLRLIVEAKTEEMMLAKKAELLSLIRG